MAEGMAFGLAESLLTKVVSSAFQEIGLLYGVKDELKKLEDILTIINAVLVDAEEKQESHAVRIWIKRLEQVVYDADDLLDKFAYQDLRRKLDKRMARQVSDFFSSSNQLAFRFKMGHAIKDIIGRLDEIANDISKFSFLSNRAIVNTRFVGNRERDTDSFVFTPDIIGREKEKNEMIKILISNTDDSSVSPIIPIVGIGGLGKTALAKLVFNDERVVKHFEPRIWVCVSEDFKKEVIVRNILGENLEDCNMEKLQNLLRKKLDGKRYLLVLDDVWNEDSERWIQLERLLMVEANGSIIMVTTRDKKVASAMGINSPFLLKGLSDEQSLELFEKLAFKEGLQNVHHELKEIGKELVTRCKGVPLAIKTLGSTMRSKTSVSEWESIQTNKIWALSSGNSGILSVLKLSYDQLPTHLKYCFSYCSIFPKDHKIQCEMLIQLWMAQGYVQSSERSETLEEIGIDYVKDFLSLSFFQEVEVDDYKSITSFKMHDLIHDLALEVAASNYYFIAENDAKNSNVERVHHVSLASGLGELPERLLKEKGTRTFFLSVGKYSGWKLSQINVRQYTIMSNFKCLRVLDLNDCGIKKIRSSIDLLMHLRYFDLSGNRELKGLPNSISNLLNLQTLKLSGCLNMEKLPMGITKLINLRYLMIDGCDDLKHMPSGLKKLVLLQRLPIFVVGKDKDKWGHSPCGRLSELKDLNKLGGELCIKNIGMVGVDDAAATNLKEKEHLQSLILDWISDWGISDWGYKERPLATTTADLVLEGLEPHPNLKELVIDRYRGEKFPSWMTKMDNMVKITIRRCDRCQQLQPLDQLRSLKFLSLYRLDSLEYIQEEVRDGQPPSSSVLFFPSLQELQLKLLPELKGWWRKRESKVSEEEEEEEYASSSSSSLVFPQLTKLNIGGCPMLSSMPRHSPLLLLEELELTSVGEKLLRDRLMPSLISYSSFSRLKTLFIGDIKNLKALPPRCLQNLTSLESLRISDCSELLYLTSSGEGKGQGFRDLTSLRFLEIFSCRNLKSLSKELRHLTSLEDLKIRYCDLADDDDGMHWQGLRSLRRLEITYIPNLVTLPVGIQHLTTLQHLHIRNCYEFLAVPDWIGNLTQLQQLGFSHCPNLASLPQEIRCLTSLQQLEIYKCPKLSERCQIETGEDWLKIAHIPNIKIDYHMIRGTYFFLHSQG